MTKSNAIGESANAQLDEAIEKVAKRMREQLDTIKDEELMKAMLRVLKDVRPLACEAHISAEMLRNMDGVINRLEERLK